MRNVTVLSLSIQGSSLSMMNPQRPENLVARLNAVLHAAAPNALPLFLLLPAAPLNTIECSLALK
jgi:hypothetical protein